MPTHDEHVSPIDARIGTDCVVFSFAPETGIPDKVVLPGMTTSAGEQRLLLHKLEKVRAMMRSLPASDLGAQAKLDSLDRQEAMLRRNGWL